MAEDVKINITGDSKPYAEELNKASKATDDFNDNLKTIGVTAGVAFAALSASAAYSISQFAESEQVANQLDAVLKNVGASAGVTSEQVLAMATSLEAQTKFSDESIASAATLLLSFKTLGKDVLPQATKAVLDLATLMKTDATSAADTLGRALANPVEGTDRLRRAGIKFTDAEQEKIRVLVLSGKVTEAQGLILEKVESRVNGLAEASARGTGVFAQLKNSFSNLAEEIGKQLAPTVETAAAGLKDLIEWAQKNPQVIKLAVAVGSAAAAMTGLVTALAAGALIFAQLQTALIAVGAIIGTTAATAGILVVAIGALIAAAAYLALNWSTVFPRIEKIFAAFTQNVSELAGGLGEVLLGVFSLDFDRIKGGLAQLKETLKKGYEEAFAAIPENPKDKKDRGTASVETTPAANAEVQALIKAEQEKEKVRQEALAKKEADRLKSLESDEKTLAERRANQEKEIEQEKAQADLLSLERSGASKRIQEIAKEQYAIEKQIRESNNVNEIDELVKKNEKLTALRLEVAAQDAEEKQIIQDDILANNEEFQTLTEEQQAQFIERNQQLLKDAANTQAELRDKAIKTDIEKKKGWRDQEIADTKQYGAANAAVNKFFREDELGRSADHFTSLQKLQQSNNGVLRTIGKAAALVQIGQDTARGATQALTAFPIPFIGPALGFAAAAAIIAFGAEQAAKVAGLAEGGLVTGGIRGIDSIPAMLSPGELVVPQKNFEEVVSSVAASRQGAAGQVGATGASGSVSVEISLTGDASRLFTAQQIESRNLGLSRDNLGT